MKRFLLYVIALSLLLSLCGCGRVKPHSLGVPYSHLEAGARTVWDLVLFEGKLYAGAGDFDNNISPEYVMRYDFEKGKWENCGVVHDEQINRFLILDGDLYIPGTDPTGSWESGAFYRLENGTFVEYATVPHGVHTFDMALYGGVLFVALGVDDGRYPVARSHDGGMTFETVFFYRDGEAVPTENGKMINRCYDLFLLKDSLYAVYFDELYRFDKTLSAFVFEKPFLTRPSAGGVAVPIQSDALFADRLFYTTTTLYAAELSEDGVSDPEAISFDGVERVTHLFVWEDTLYLLAYGEGRVRVFETKDGEHFSEAISFESEIRANSFVYDGKCFYFGMGEYRNESEKCGEILTMAYPLPEN